MYSAALSACSKDGHGTELVLAAMRGPADSPEDTGSRRTPAEYGAPRRTAPPTSPIARPAMQGPRCTTGYGRDAPPCPHHASHALPCWDRSTGHLLTCLPAHMNTRTSALKCPPGLCHLLTCTPAHINTWTSALKCPPGPCHLLTCTPTHMNTWDLSHRRL